MADAAHDPDHDSTDHQSNGQRLDIRRLGLVLSCAVVALIAGYIGGLVGQAVSWSALAGNLSVLVVAFIVAAACLRAVDLAALRRNVSDRVAQSRSHSSQVRQRLEELDPGIASKAGEIDAERLVSRFLSGSDRPATKPQ